MSSPHQSVNPWSWQDQFGFSQAVTAPAPSRWVFCAGQTSTDGDGAPLHPGDMGAQVVQSLDSTLLGVARLAYPDLLLEIEATALVP